MKSLLKLQLTAMAVSSARVVSRPKEKKPEPNFGRGLLSCAALTYWTLRVALTLCISEPEVPVMVSG